MTAEAPVAGRLGAGATRPRIRLVPHSLAGRLIVAATLWSSAALIVAGLILTSLYRQTVVAAFDERLNVYLLALVGALQPIDLSEDTVAAKAANPGAGAGGLATAAKPAPQGAETGASNAARQVAPPTPTTTPAAPGASPSAPSASLSQPAPSPPAVGGGRFPDQAGPNLGQLAAGGTPSASSLVLPGNLGDPRFENGFSGWYWQVRERGRGAVLFHSNSLFAPTVLDIGKASDVRTNADGSMSGALTGPLNQSLRVVQRTIEFQNAGRTVDILVAGDAGEVGDQITAFSRSVALTLAVFGVGLVAATFFQIRWGLRPLDRVRRSLADLSSGKQTRVSGKFPAEIRPLVKELNALLQSNQEVIDRARTQVGNLAHALKTPLSVILNEARASREPLAAKVAEQATLMHRQVSHHLDRARIAAKVNVISASVEVGPAVARLVRAMQRIHGDKGISVTCHVPAEARFRGEQQDLEEIVGNLADNACKWCKKTVTVSGEYVAPRSETDPGRLVLRIDDDGPGLTDGEVSEALGRGKRLDETKPGSGLGLSIVTDLVGLYAGETHFARSPAGGLRVEVRLPAA